MEIKSKRAALDEIGLCDSYYYILTRKHIDQFTSMMLKTIFNSLRDINGTYSRCTWILQNNCRTITTTSPLFAEPPRKKRRIDPAVFKVRTERKIKKVEREINKLESEPRQAAPILEYQLTNSDIRDLKSRPQHKMEDFALTQGALRAARRLWTFYRHEQSAMERRSIARIEAAQTRALAQLESLDIDLYRETVAVDDTVLIPYRSSHMRRETAPNPDYTPPDGVVKDVTKDWVM